LPRCRAPQWPWVVNRDVAIGVHDFAAAPRIDPLERITGQPFIGAALKHETEHAVVAGCALTVLDDLGARRHFFPGGGNRLAIFPEKIGAIVEDTRIGEPRYRLQFAVDRVILDDRFEVPGLGPVHVRRKIDEVRAQDAGPDHVDLEDVDVIRLRGQ